jgi:hypothetical protein
MRTVRNIAFVVMVGIYAFLPKETFGSSSLDRCDDFWSYCSQQCGGEVCMVPWQPFCGGAVSWCNGEGDAHCACPY